MKRFAVILFAAVAMTFAAASGAQAAQPLPIVWPPSCITVPPGFTGKCVPAQHSDSTPSRMPPASK